MKNRKEIQIDEENTQIIWGLIAVVSIALATYVLINAFMAASWTLAGSTQLLSLALFTIGFYGIIRISSPLFHFILYINDNLLHIEIWREGEQPLDIHTIPLKEIEELRIAPHSPRASDEALFDFSSSYYPVYRRTDQAEYRRLISLEEESFTLKVDDIGKIMEFLTTANPEIRVPESDAVFMEISGEGATEFKTARGSQ